jgi:two-component system KDP operon response regulator KdpE
MRVMDEPPPVALIVEDDRNIRRFVSASLISQGWQVHEADSLAQARAELKARKHNLVLVDLGLPDGNGVDFIVELRNSSHVPVIVLSARAEEADKVRALDVGADDYVQKPFGSAELLARIRANLRRGARGTIDDEDAIVIGDVEVDRAARVVRKAGREVHLTPIEYRLFNVLLSNAGRVITHRQLLREAWGPSHGEHTQSLRVFMGTLRHKLEDDPAMPKMLLTETGVGYRLVGR